MESCKTWDENRRLHRQLSRTVLLEAIQNDGAVVPEGTEGNQLRQAVGIMDGSISKALQSGAAPVELELWQLHTKHITKVNDNGGRSQGRKNATYHPMLIIWAMAFLARTSARTYNEVGKIMMLPHICTIYRKAAEQITTKNDKASCLHMSTICSISDRACHENWMSHQRIGAIAQDSATSTSEV
jgi:hypothetical protein